MGNYEQEQLLSIQYKQNHEIYKSFCSYLEGQIKEILKTKEISYYELSFRIKTLDSILEKIERNSLSVESISNIHDLIGFRIIALFKRDVALICDIIRQNFQIVWEEDKAGQKPDDTFGYLSVHFQISVQQNWLHSPTTHKYAGLEAELQVRTFSQHVWAASSHLLQYKKESSIPYTMRRNINRLAAVLEIVDDELESILNAREAYQLSLKENSCSEERVNQRLDSLLLEHILDEVFSGENKGDKEPYDDLLEELFFCGVNTGEYLKRLLSDEANKIQTLEQSQSKKNGGPFYSYAGKVRIALQSHFPGLYAKIRNRNL